MYPNLRKELQRKKISIAELAKQLEIAESTLNQKINGRREVNVYQAIKIKKAIGSDKPLEYLFAEG